MKPRARAPDQALSPRRSTPLTRVQLQQLLEQKDKCVGDLYVCVCVWWGVVFFIIILLGEADKTHLIVLCYYVTKTGLVGAAALLPTFHTYLGDKATDCTSLVSGCIIYAK